jgi:hypothetical protein
MRAAPNLRALRDGLEAAGRHLGEAMWIAPAGVHRTRGIGQQQTELRNDRDIDGLELMQVFGERAQRLLMLEHQLMAHRDVGRSVSLGCGALEEHGQTGRDFPSLRMGPKAARPDHELAGAPRVGALRERRVELSTSQDRADAQQLQSHPTPWQGANPALACFVPHRDGPYRGVRRSAWTAHLASSQRRAANRAASPASWSRASAAANPSLEGGGAVGQLAAARR